MFETKTHFFDIVTSAGFWRAFKYFGIRLAENFYTSNWKGLTLYIIWKIKEHATNKTVVIKITINACFACCLNIQNEWKTASIQERWKFFKLNYHSVQILQSRPYFPIHVRRFPSTVPPGVFPPLLITFQTHVLDLHLRSYNSFSGILY